MHGDGVVDRRTGFQIGKVPAGDQFQKGLRFEQIVDHRGGGHAEDAQFAFTQTHLKANGSAFDPVALPETLGGPLVWISVPGYGRYVLSFLAHPELGFALAGEVSGHSLIFTVAGNMFRIDCGERIASGSGTYNVYALLDAAWMPADPEDQGRFSMGSVPGVQ